MGRVMEMITGRASAPGTTQTALTMHTGDSATIRAANLSSPIYLLQTWVDVQGAGTFRIRSPYRHDNVQGIRFNTVVSEVEPLLPMGFKERLQPQEALILEITGSATSGDLENAALLLYYEDLPGIQQNMASVEAVMSRMEHLVTVENTLALGTGGGYTGEEALNAETDLLKPNTNYALIGYHVDDECLAVGWRGSETGNLRVGGPGNDTDKEMTKNWFIHLSRVFGLPLIPVFNYANASNILLDGVQDENGTDVTVTSIFAELRG